MPRKAIVTILALVVLWGLAFLVRLMPYSQVFNKEPFADGSSIALYGTDPDYHVRRILLTMVTFPRVQYYDSYFGYPGGGRIYWPPIFDWTLAGMAKALGYSAEDREAVLRFLVFIPPVLGAFTVVLAYLFARRFMDGSTAFTSAALFAVIPGHVSYSLLSRVDHHVGEMLAVVLVFVLLAWGLETIEKKQRVLWGVVTGCGAAMALALGISLGSFIFVLLIAGFIILAAAMRMRNADPTPALILRFGWGTLLAAVIFIGPLCLRPPWLGPHRETFLGLSWAHLYLLVALTGTLFITERICRALVPGWKAAMLVLATSVVLLALALLCAHLAAPWLVAPFAQQGQYFTKADAWLENLSEAQPLFFDRGIFRPDFGQVMLTQVVFIYPLLVLMLFLIRPRTAAFDFFLFLSGIMLFLGFAKKRFVYFLALTLSLALGYFLVRIVRWVFDKSPEGGLRGPRLAVGGVLAACCVFAIYPSLNFYWPISDSWAKTTLPFYSAPAPVRETFAWMRDHTPPTRFYMRPTQRPEYGVLYGSDTSPWLISYAHRPTVGTFWGVLRFDHKERTTDVYRFFMAEDEATANAICDRNNVRYVVTWPIIFYVRDFAVYATLDPDRYMVLTRRPDTGEPVFQATPYYYHLIGHRLYDNDGVAREEVAVLIPTLHRYRLLYESRSFTDPFTGNPGTLKVFEYVKGARLTGCILPGAPVRAETEVVTNQGRQFTYRARTEADSQGRFTLIVPYPTTRVAGGAVTPYRISALGVERSIEVSLEAVYAGHEVKVKF